MVWNRERASHLYRLYVEDSGVEDSRSRLRDRSIYVCWEYALEVPRKLRVLEWVLPGNAARKDRRGMEKVATEIARDYGGLLTHSRVTLLFPDRGVRDDLSGSDEVADVLTADQWPSRD